MNLLILCCFSIFIGNVSSAIRRSGGLLNKLNIKMVGLNANDDLDGDGGNHEHVLTTESHRRALHEPKTMLRALGGRKMNPGDCTATPEPQLVFPGPNVEIVDEFYDDHGPMTVATVVFPTHIDIHHFEVTTPVPYLTVGIIPGIGFHPTTHNPDECEKIYQDFLAAEYSAEKKETSESEEYVRRPVDLQPWDYSTQQTGLPPCATYNPVLHE